MQKNWDWRVHQRLPRDNFQGKVTLTGDLKLDAGRKKGVSKNWSRRFRRKGECFSRHPEMKDLPCLLGSSHEPWAPCTSKINEKGRTKLAGEKGGNVNF